VIPVCNEGADIERALAELHAKVPPPKRVLAVYETAWAAATGPRRG
jgi:hypothetical protein